MGAVWRNRQGLERQRHRTYALMSGGSAKRGVESIPDFGQLDRAVLAKVTGAKQLTLPDDLLASFPGVDCFNMTEEGGRIVLTPVRIRRVDAVRQKLAELDITDEDVRDAVAWARRRD